MVIWEGNKKPFQMWTNVDKLKTIQKTRGIEAVKPFIQNNNRYKKYIFVLLKEDATSLFWN